MIDAILGDDTNPLMSGIAAFNAQLGQRLDVPVYSLVQGWQRAKHPLVSIRGTGEDVVWARFAEAWTAFDVFWHADFQPCLTSRARRVFAANTALAERIRPHRPDVIAAHCPGLIQARGAFPQTDLTVFTFGHAHKLRVDLYAQLKALLDATGRSYTVYLSAGLHTGASAADDPFLALQRLFGERLIFLGILSDRAVAHYLATCTYVAAFFESGVRENNTTVNAALEAGATVLTNCDARTPAALRAAVLDVTTSQPLCLARVPAVNGLFDGEAEGFYEDRCLARSMARPQAVEAYSWDRLLAVLRQPGDLLERYPPAGDHE